MVSVTISLFVSNFTRSYCMENANPSEFTERNIRVRVTIVSVLCCVTACKMNHAAGIGLLVPDLT